MENFFPFFYVFFFTHDCNIIFTKDFFNYEIFKTIFTSRILFKRFYFISFCFNMFKKKNSFIDEILYLSTFKYQFHKVKHG